jgi:hypothetical protein
MWQTRQIARISVAIMNDARDLILSTIPAFIGGGQSEECGLFD